MAIEHVTDIEIRAFQEPPFGYGVQIYIVGNNLANGKRVYVPSLEFIEVSNAGFTTLPTLSISLHKSNMLQVLMDDLWKIGVHPTEGKGSAGAMVATQEHLKDMQRLTFDLLEKVLKE